MTVPLAIISNEQTPYRIHLHRRIAREMPEVMLWSLFTHEAASSPWPYQEVAEIRPVRFGEGEPSTQQGRVDLFWHEWAKGGRITAWLARQGIRAVVLGGYNDPGRIRILRWCDGNGIRCFLFGDSNILNDQPTGIRKIVKSAVLPRLLGLCAGALYCGKLGKAYFERYLVPADRLFPFPYEPNYSQIEMISAGEQMAVRARFELPPQGRLLLYSGRLVSVKRVDLLLDAFSQIAEDRPDWNLVIAGDGPLRAGLEGSIPAPLRNRVTWTGFVEDSATLAALYATCDALVLPSDREPWGVVVTEAAVRMAIVASTAVGAAADVVRDGINGRIFAAGDAGGLAAALQEVTDPVKIDGFKASSPVVLDEWRRQMDPVDGLRCALRSVGLLR